MLLYTHLLKEPYLSIIPFRLLNSLPVSSRLLTSEYGKHDLCQFSPKLIPFSRVIFTVKRKCKLITQVKVI